MTMVLTIVDGALSIDARCYAPELAERRTAIDDLAAIGIALRDGCVFLGMRVGYLRPLLQSYASCEFERTQPRSACHHWGLRSGAILDLIDTRFHASDGLGADSAEVRLARSDSPDWVARTEHDGLVMLKWCHSRTPRSSFTLNFGDARLGAGSACRSRRRR